MNLNFDYYNNLEEVDFYLCNPDGRELFPISCENRILTLRFNDLSELAFDIYSTMTISSGQKVELEAYDYIEGKRLVFVTSVGWFQITQVNEHDTGTIKYKSVVAESYQSILKNVGFISEERVYCFYNPVDPFDEKYDSRQEDHIPSVLGQWFKQLGIKQNLGLGTSTPITPFDEWTVTYINSDLIYSGEQSICRTFKESTTYGYDWIVNDVEGAFEVAVLFDFMYKTIHVKRAYEITSQANVVYTFNNFMKSIDISEETKDIVTVLNCNGSNCDITQVNPTGTNYICDFSYYMNKNGRWMSDGLIDKLEAWQIDVNAQEIPYKSYISTLRSHWLVKTKAETELRGLSLIIQDLKTAQSKRSVLAEGTERSLAGIVAVESVLSGARSVEQKSNYFNTSFAGSAVVTAYAFQPTYIPSYREESIIDDDGNEIVGEDIPGRWAFSGAYMTASADSIIEYNLANENTGTSYWYFNDVGDGSSYCKLEGATTVNTEDTTAKYYCGGFERYIAYCYPFIETNPKSPKNGNQIYVDQVQYWIDLREKSVLSLNVAINATQEIIDGIVNELDKISSKINITAYFSNTPNLLRELKCYWIEGDYTNENITILDETTPEQEIKLMEELLESGRLELSKVCQPRYSFAIDSIDATKNYEFRSQMQELELGKIITIEKEDGLWFYPALLSIKINLDTRDEFEMTFANAARLDDWGFTYADLISDASSTSRQVSANWQELLSYSKDKETISNLIRNPLDMTLRASFVNMTNQEFTIDQSGILGRKKIYENAVETSDFEDEQIRLINNLIIFTDDRWETAKTALGKIYYYDEKGSLVSSYGLIAETIIGSLIMGEKLEIRNANSSVLVDANGVKIINANGDVVFQAAPDGTLIVRNFATSSELDEFGNRLGSAEASISVMNGEIALKANQMALTSLANSVGALTNRVTTAETSITVNANAIKLKANQSTVDSISTSLGDVTTRLTTAEANITVTANAISLKADQSTVNYVINEMGNITEQVTSMESELITMADNISAKVSEVDGDTRTFGWSLKVGGFYIYSNSKEVMKVTSSGLEVTGRIIAINGTFDNCKINETCEIYGVLKANKICSNGEGNIYTTGDITYTDGTSIQGGQYIVRVRNVNNNNLRAYMAVTDVQGAMQAELKTVTVSGYITTTAGITVTGTNVFVSGNTLTISNSFAHNGNGSFYGQVAFNNNVVFNQAVTLASGHGIYINQTSTSYAVPFLALYDRNGNMVAQHYYYYSESRYKISASYGQLEGTWYSNSGSIITSDMNKKNSISAIEGNYDILFDNLNPCLFKYNDGTSDRLHTGFIAQDVGEALAIAKIASSDFAALCIDEAGGWGLRYEEFVSLNTLQIQKLKPRMSKAEEKIVYLENEVIELKEEIARLKNGLTE